MADGQSVLEETARRASGILGGFVKGWMGADESQAIGQIYINWLYSYLYALQFTDRGMGDPSKEGSDAYKLLEQAANAVDAGANLVTLPYFDQFYNIYQDIYPAEEVTAAMTPEETAYLESQTELNQARAQQILNDIAATGQITPAQQAELDLAMQQLEFQMKQAGVGTELDWAELDLARQRLTQEVALAQQRLTQETALEQQRLALEERQYRAELQASPATWIERWYAERQPGGGERIPLASDELLAQWAAQATTPAAGWQAPAAAGGAATPTVPTGGATWQPPTTITPTLPGGMTTEQATAMYTPEELRTGLLEAGKTDPLMTWAAQNIGSMTDEEIAFWTRSTAEPGVWEELQARAQELGLPYTPDIGADVMRNYARQLRRQRDLAEAIERNLYPQAIEAVIEKQRTEPGWTIEQEYGLYPWKNYLLHLRGIEEAASMSFEEWYATTRVNPWETEADVRRRYEGARAEAAELGIPLISAGGVPEVAPLPTKLPTKPPTPVTPPTPAQLGMQTWQTGIPAYIPPPMPAPKKILRGAKK